MNNYRKLARHVGDPHAQVSMADRMKAADAIEKLLEQLEWHQHETALRDMAIDAQDARIEKLLAVYEAVVPLHLSGTHLYDLDSKLGEAIAAIEGEGDD